MERTAGPEALGVSDAVLGSFVRVVTHPRIYADPTPVEDALSFCTVLRDHANTIRIAPGPRHWELFESLCRRVRARGNLVPDAYLAALAIEHGATWATTDRDYARFPGLRIVHPLEASA